MTRTGLAVDKLLRETASLFVPAVCTVKIIPELKLFISARKQLLL
jgi:hypothetical protein